METFTHYSYNWLKLFEKLIKKADIPRTVIKFLTKLYLNNLNTVSYQNVYSTSFTTTQGLRQGSILSPYLYNIYTEYLIQHIKDLNIGVFLPDGTNVSILAFADDIILISTSLHNLQSLLDECVKSYQNHGIKINDRKTQFVISGKPMINDTTLRLNETHIDPQNTLTHLGFKWSKNQKNKLDLRYHLQLRISEAWATTASLINAGITHQNPHAIATIFSSIIIPKLTYGLSIIKLTKNDKTKINSVARCILENNVWCMRETLCTLPSI